MYGLKCFVLQNLMKGIIALEKPVYNLTKGKLCKNRFLSAVKTRKVPGNVKILKSTENSTYIAKMNPDGSFSDEDFRILCSTDLHIDEDYELNNRTLQHLADRIADLKPDLVVLTGDCILSKYQQIDAIQFAKMMEDIGVQTIVYTDIATDGTLMGPNVEAMSEMVKSTNMNIIASGGIGSIEHIKSLVQTGVEGVITGRALYTGNIDLPEAIKAGRGE